MACLPNKDTMDIPRELLGSTDDAPASTILPLPQCTRCGTSDLDDDGDCPSCAQAALDERIRAAQEGRTPEDWAVVREGQRVGGRPINRGGHVTYHGINSGWFPLTDPDDFGVGIPKGEPPENVEIQCDLSFLDADGSISDAVKRFIVKRTIQQVLNEWDWLHCAEQDKNESVQQD